LGFFAVARATKAVVKGMASFIVVVGGGDGELTFQLIEWVMVVLFRGMVCEGLQHL
jgi:hypothetical protein